MHVELDLANVTEGELWPTLGRPEAACVKAGQTTRCADPNLSRIGRLRERMNLRVGKSGSVAVLCKPRAVISEKAIVSAHPQKADPILKQCVDVQVGQTFLTAILLESLLLGFKGQS